jgi:hypothetical protein
MALAALAVPWAIYPVADAGARLAAVGLGALLSALWPVLLGSLVFGGVWSRRSKLPELPEGDIVVAGEAAARATIGASEAIERADAWLRQWPVASLSLLTVAILLAAVMLIWR